MKKGKNPLLDKMREGGYEDLSDFRQRSGVPISHETLRVAIYEGREVSIPSLYIILKYLGFTPAEIKKKLKEAGDDDFSEYIGDGAGKPLQEWEKALLGATRRLREQNPDSLTYLANTLDWMGKAEGVNIAAEIGKLRRKPIKRRG